LCPGSEFQEKMDVLDLIIGILREHEESLSKIAERFESVIKNLDAVEGKVSSLNDTLAQAILSRAPISSSPKPAAVVECKDWTTFRERIQGGGTVAFEADQGVFIVSSLTEGVISTYSEYLPEVKFQVAEGEKRCIIEKMSLSSPGDLSPIFERRLRCGLEVEAKNSKFELPDGEQVFRLTYEIDPAKTRRWLAKELKIPQEDIVEGRLTYSAP